MPPFDARLRLPGQSRLPLGVEVDVAPDRVTVRSGDRPVASWPRKGLVVESQADGFHITVDGEEVVLNVTDSPRFAAAMGVPMFARRAAVIGERRSGEAPGASAPDRPVAAASDGAPASVRAAAPDLTADYQGRIAEVAAALRSDSLSAAQAFTKWVRLLKEINHRHGQGTMPCDQFFRLNTQVLDLIPEPKPDSDLAPTDEDSTGT